MLRMTFTPRRLAFAVALSATALFGTACSAADTELAEPIATASTSVSARGTAPVSDAEEEAETAPETAAAGEVCGQVKSYFGNVYNAVATADDTTCAEATQVLADYIDKVNVGEVSQRNRAWSSDEGWSCNDQFYPDGEDSFNSQGRLHCVSVDSFGEASKHGFGGVAAMPVDEQTSTTAAPAPADGDLAPQNASRFEAGLGTYNVRFSEGNWCSYSSMAGKLECGLELTGTLPPSTQRLDIGGLHTIQYSQDRGFYWGRALVGTMPDKGDDVAPGEKLEAPGALFEHHPDGTLRVEFENHWFTVSPDGQYASDTFDPAR